MRSNPIWRTSSHSGGQGNCVEVATNLPGQVFVRDSKDPGTGLLAFSAQTWEAFTASVKSASGVR